jgi:FMN phosphatase YigB (HAD superfamily)
VCAREVLLRAMESLPDRLRDWRTRSGARALLIDLDDTLLDTEALFVRSFATCVSRIRERRPERAHEEVAGRIRDVNVASYERMGANLARRWPWVAEQLRAEFAPRDVALERELVAALAEIQASVPAEHAGARDTLRHFRQAGFAVAVVTHACVQWTQRKLAGTQLDALVDHVHVAHEDGVKDAAAWSRAMVDLAVGPGEAIVVGDSLRSDIRAGFSAGVRRLVWIRRSDGWQHAHVGALPEGARTVASVGDVPAALVS